MNRNKMKNDNRETLQIIKIGGALIDDEAKLTKALKAFAAINGKKILVHGGGKLATEISGKLGIKSKMHHGRRMTTRDELAVVTMVYAGLINKQIVARLQALRCNALGLSGADANVIECDKRAVGEIDYGFAGDIRKVNHKEIELLMNNGLVPVFCAITHNLKGQLLNTNADTIASEVAIALSQQYSTELVFCFDKPGVLMDINNPDSVIASMNRHQFQKLKEEKIIHAGMLPKLEKGFDARKQGVSKVIIGDINTISGKSMLSTILI